MKEPYPFYPARVTRHPNRGQYGAKKAVGRVDKKKKLVKNKRDIATAAMLTAVCLGGSIRIK